MAKSEPFDRHSNRYEDWFEVNRAVYQSELEAVKYLLPEDGKGIEIGVGSGRFAVPLGIGMGIEPSEEMAKRARNKGIHVIEGVAENIPCDDGEFDFALMTTTLCFLDDVSQAFREVHRILKKGGVFVVGFIDKDSRIGRSYQRHKEESDFYRIATFYSTSEVISLLKDSGFSDFISAQTVFHDLSSINCPEPVNEGHGEGSFVVIKSKKP